MAKTGKELIAEEEAKRKALSKVRVFWLCLFVNLALIIYIIFQVSLLANK